MPLAASSPAPIMVTGATGAQGGAVARRLLAGGLAVRALVRDTEAPASRVLRAAGADVVGGDLDDPASLVAACVGASGVFSVQLSSPLDDGKEQRQAQALIRAARQTGVSTFVQTSVSGARAHRDMTGWAEGRWSRHYWESKVAVEDDARAAGFDTVVILKPAFMMENFLQPKAAFMFPDLAAGEIVTAVDPATPIALVAAADIGSAAAAAFSDPVRFQAMDIELAGDVLTLPQIAEGLAAAWRVSIKARTLPAAAIVARGQFTGWVQTQEWFNIVGYPARPLIQTAMGLTPTRLVDWAADQGEAKPR